VALGGALVAIVLLGAASHLTLALAGAILSISLLGGGLMFGSTRDVLAVTRACGRCIA
jgi:hypothetical protein